MKRREEGYIEDLGSGEVELDRTCTVISQVVRKGGFTLERALEAYEVSMEEYADYMARHLASQISEEVDMIFMSQNSARSYVHLKVSVLAALQEKLFPSYHNKIQTERYFKHLETDALGALK